jgi:hypothetical protein
MAVPVGPLSVRLRGFRRFGATAFAWLAEPKLSLRIQSESEGWYVSGTVLCRMSSPATAALSEQIAWLFILPIAIACISWTVTHEEIFREAREYAASRSQSGPNLLIRKFFYVFTCEYCFSHYVTIAFLLFTGCRLLLDDWRGSVIAFFALTGIANAYLSGYARLRVDIKAERVQIEAVEKELERDRPDRNAMAHR